MTGRLRFLVWLGGLILCVLLPLQNNAASVENFSDRFEYLNQSHGLSQSIVYCIHQDKFGFIWFGTRNGLNRYDGTEFVVYKHDPMNRESLSNNTIRSICGDGSGDLWIGTWGGGVNRFDAKTGGFVHLLYGGKENPGAPTNFVHRVLVDSRKRLWILSSAGLSRYRIDGAKSIAGISADEKDGASILPGRVSSIIEDHENTIWVGTVDGLSRFDESEERFHLYRIGDTGSGRKGRNTVRSVYEDNRNRLWVGTESGEVFLFSRGKEEFQPWRVNGKPMAETLRLDAISCIYQDGYGDFWIGTLSKGVVKFSPESTKIIHYTYDPDNPEGLSDNRVKSILMDRSASLWIGTDSGLNKSSRYRKKFKLYRHNPRRSGKTVNQRVRSIGESAEGRLLIGMADGLVQLDADRMGISRFSPDVFSRIEEESRIVNTILKDVRGDLWLGTNGGLLVFRSGERGYSRFRNRFGDPLSLVHDKVWAIHELDENTLLIGTMGGMARFDKTSGRFENYTHDPGDSDSLCCNYVHAICRDSEGGLWVGTDAGLDRFDAAHGRFHHYMRDSGSPGGPGNNNVWVIHESRDQVLWVGTMEGLARYNRRLDRFVACPAESVLSRRAIYGLLEDDVGMLWISTDSGLYRFDPAHQSIRHYDINDGLQGNEFGLGCCFKSKSGEFFFGGNDGFNAFFPEEVADNPSIPPVVITDIRVFGASLKMSEGLPVSQCTAAPESIAISHENDFLTFRFAAMDYTIPSKNQYAYILEGFQKDWRYCGTENQATYTNLPYGKYVFRVKGSNNDGRWNETGTSLAVNIRPPFWATWWFRMIGISLLILFVAFSLNAREKHIRRKAVLNEKVSQLVMSQKMRLVGLLAAGATHDLSSILFTIIRCSDKLSTGGPRRDSSAYAEQLRGAAEKAIQIVKQILAFSRPGPVRDGPHDLSRLIDEVVEILGATIPPGVRVQWQRSAESLRMKVDPIRFQQMMMNLIFNSIEALPEGGKIQVHACRERENRILITVEDNGNGMDAGAVKKIFMPYFSTKSQSGNTGLGLFVVQRVVDDYRGRIRVDSEPGKGTRFRICFPGEK